MPVVFDTSYLIHLVHPELPLEHPTGTPVPHVAERINQLIAELHTSNTKIIIPTPVLGEWLVITEAVGGEYLKRINRSSAFQVTAFDERAAIELAFVTAKAIAAGDKKAGSKETIAKVKFDRQIVTTAIVNGATAIYSNDRNLRTFAEANKIKVFSVWELPVPDELRQTNLMDVLNALQAKEKAGE